MRTRVDLIALTLLACTVAGCGGGGSSVGSAPPATSPPPTAPNQPPDIALTATPVSGGAPLLVTFDAGASDDPDGTIVSYRWDFADSSPIGVGSAVNHRFDDPGSYLVRLTIRDDDGSTASRSLTIDVTPAPGLFSLSGRVRILASSAIDSDVNDLSTTPVSNDDFNDAQVLPNPVTAGGYINQPGTGADGNLRASGDPGDFYRISLTGNETILLTAGDPSNGDLTLQLWRANPLQLVDSVIITGNAGSLDAPGAGDFFIEVDALDGFTTYVLNVGQNVGGAALESRAPRISDDFVAGQLVVLGEPIEPRTLAGEDLRVVRHSSRATLVEQTRRSEHRPTMRGAELGGQVSPAQWKKWETLRSIRRLRQRSGIRDIEPNYIRRAHRVPDDPFYVYQWHFEDISLPLAWDLPQGSADVVVAIIDTGVLLAHPDLRNAPGEPVKLLPGYDFITSPARANDGDGPDPDPNDPGDFAFGSASSFHGTHVAGTVAARSDNGVGVAGVSWNATLMPLRVLGIDGGTSFDVTQAVLYAAGLDNATGQLPAQRADIINMSLGSLFSSVAEQQAISDARAQGVIVIASAGNDASATPSFPAAYDGVVAVSATTISRTLAPYSNRGSWVDVAAPGGSNATDLNGDGIGDGVISTLGDDSGPGPVVFGYAGLSGTSMAAPHVAGVAALMKAAHPGLTPDEFDTALSQGALSDDLGSPGRDNQFGHGLINAQQALVTAFDLANNSGSPIPAVLTGSPSSLNFGAFDTELPVTVSNAGEGVAAVSQVTSDAPWLSPTPGNIDADGLGTYLLQVDRTGLMDGTHFATVRFLSNASEFGVSVVMQKTSLDLAANAGLHYILLVDATTDTPIHFVTASAVDGEYAFSFANVAAGEYQIIAGTDSDNDNFLCDGGEACGAYRTLDSPDTILINSDRNDLDFVSGFRVNLFSTSAAAQPDSSDSSDQDSGTPLYMQGRGSGR
jgi:serine protease